jgi:hypothetical protein
VEKGKKLAPLSDQIEYMSTGRVLKDSQMYEDFRRDLKCMEDAFDKM